MYKIDIQCPNLCMCLIPESLNPMSKMTTHALRKMKYNELFTIPS